MRDDLTGRLGALSGGRGTAPVAPRALVSPSMNIAAVPAPAADARAFHAGLDGYAPTPPRELPGVAQELGLGAVALKDETARLGLPAFKVLGASWALERALRERPEIDRLVASLRALAGDPACAALRAAVGLGSGSRVALLATEGPTDPDGYRRALAAA